MNNSAFMPTNPGQVPQDCTSPPSSSHQQVPATQLESTPMFFRVAGSHLSASSMMNQATAMPFRMENAAHNALPQLNGGQTPYTFGSQLPNGMYPGVPQVQQSPPHAFYHATWGPGPSVNTSYIPLGPIGAPANYAPGSYAAVGQNTIVAVYESGRNATTVINGSLVQNTFGPVDPQTLNLERFHVPPMHTMPSAQHTPALFIGSAQHASASQRGQYQNLPLSLQPSAHSSSRQNGAAVNRNGVTVEEEWMQRDDAKKRVRKPTQCGHCKAIGHNKTGCPILNPKPKADGGLSPSKKRRKNPKNVEESVVPIGVADDDTNGDDGPSHQEASSSAMVKPSQKRRTECSPPQSTWSDAPQPSVASLDCWDMPSPRSLAQLQQQFAPQALPSRPSPQQLEPPFNLDVVQAGLHGNMGTSGTQQHLSLGTATFTWIGAPSHPSQEAVAPTAWRETQTTAPIRTASPQDRITTPSSQRSSSASIFSPAQQRAGEMTDDTTPSGSPRKSAVTSQAGMMRMTEMVSDEMPPAEMLSSQEPQHEAQAAQASMPAHLAQQFLQVQAPCQAAVSPLPSLSPHDLFDYDRMAPVRAQLEEPLLMFPGIPGEPISLPPWNSQGI